MAFTYGSNDPSEIFYNGSGPTNISNTTTQQYQQYNAPTNSNPSVQYTPPVYQTQTSTVNPANNQNLGGNPQSNNAGHQTIFAPPPQYAPPPSAPNVAKQQALLAQVQRQTAIKKAMDDYDALAASTKSVGFQSANNAGSIYAQRLQQQGINPLASGVVAAQAKLPVYKELADINTQKDATRIDAINKSDALAAQISASIAGLQQSYQGMLAQYNMNQAGINLDLNKFNASQAFNQQKYSTDTYFQQQSLANQQAALAASGGDSGSSSNFNPLLTPGFNPGYITNAGPIQGSSINPNIVYIGGGGVGSSGNTTALSRARRVGSPVS